jgi:hypothetical protein
VHGPPRFSVCVPYRSGATEYLLEALESAASQLPDGSELLVVPDGVAAEETVRALSLPETARVVAADEAAGGGLVSAWNRCLTHSSGGLIHLLHYDDAVAPGFYSAVSALEGRWPSASLYLTAREIFGAAPAPDPPTGGEAKLLEGDAAARLLIGQRDYSAGCAVLPRAVYERLGGFSERYPYCPDEELFFRFAAAGGVAYEPRPLYRDRAHGEQARFGTWRKPDFATVYLGCRGDGGDHFGPDVGAQARRKAAETVIWLARRFAEEGEPEVGRDRLRELATVYPAARAMPGFRASELQCRSPLLNRVIVAGRAARAAPGRAAARGGAIVRQRDLVVAERLDAADSFGARLMVVGRAAAAAVTRRR